MDNQTSEISIVDIIKKLLKTKNYFISTLTMLFIITSIYVFYEIYKQKTNQVVMKYYISLKNINDGKYPIGSPFNINQLIQPEVLERVKKKNNFEGINDFEIQSQIMTNYYFPNIELIQKKYFELSKKARSPQQVINLKNEIDEKLEDRNIIQISLNFNPSKLPIEQAKQLLLFIVKEWSDFYIQKGFMSPVLTPEIPILYSIDENRYKGNYYGYLQYLSNHIRSVEITVNQMLESHKKNQYFQNIKELNYLMESILNLEKNYFDALSIKIFDGQEKNNLTQLNLNIKIQQQKVDVLSRNINDINNFLTKLDLSSNNVYESINLDNLSNLNQEKISSILNSIGKKDTSFKIDSMLAIYFDLIDKRISEENVLANLQYDHVYQQKRIKTYFTDNKSLASEDVDQAISFFYNIYKDIIDRIIPYANEFNNYHSNSNLHQFYTDYQLPKIVNSKPNSLLYLYLYLIAFLLSLLVWFMVTVKKNLKL